MPKRIQRKRVKGWRLPENTVCVTRPGRWGNPFKVGGDVTPKMAVDLFRAWAERNLNVEMLRGKDLACFCPLDQPCHADVLLEMANTDMCVTEDTL